MPASASPTAVMPRLRFSLLPSASYQSDNFVTAAVHARVSQVDAVQPQRVRSPYRHAATTCTLYDLGVLSSVEYRRPHPFSKGLAFSETLLDRMSGNSSRSSTRAASATDTTLEPFPEGYHAPGAQHTGFSLESPPRTSNCASQVELDPWELQWAMEYGWLYDWTLDAAHNQRAFPDKAWERWLTTEQMSG